jgi:predicted CoA-binding protein
MFMEGEIHPDQRGSSMNHDRYDDSYLAEILRETKTIALLGASPNPDRPSNGVMGFLLARGYRVFPVNPGQAGKEIREQTVYARLADIPEPVDMVDVFRAAQYLDGVVEEALALAQKPKVIWGQLGVRDDDAAVKAEAGGIKVVMNRCPAIEYPRLIA